MEITAQANGALSCDRTLCFSRGNKLNIKPSLSAAPNASAESPPWFNKHRGIKNKLLITAAADDLRRRPRKGIISKGKGSTSKGFVPKTQVGTSTQKKDENDAGKEGSETSGSIECTDSKDKLKQLNASSSEERHGKVAPEGMLSSSELKPQSAPGLHSQKVNESRNVGKEVLLSTLATTGYCPDNKLSEVQDDFRELPRDDAIGATSVKSTRFEMSRDKLGDMKKQNFEAEKNKHAKAGAGKSPVLVKHHGSDLEDDATTMEHEDKDELGITIGKGEDALGANQIAESSHTNKMQAIYDVDRNEYQFSELKILDKVPMESDDINSKVAISDTNEPQFREQEVHGKGKLGTKTELKSNKMREKDAVLNNVSISEVEETELDKSKAIMGKVSQEEERILKQKLLVEAEEKKILLERLVEEKLLAENKVFFYPEVVMAEQDVEVFMNKRISVLKDVQDVFIKGAFNDWRWNFFTKKLHKRDLAGDWWSCKLCIPKEAYKLDFVFFDGGNVYENNNSKDFFVPVQNGMDIRTFEDFLLEEKRRELMKQAAEQAERERLAEEHRQKEAERAASEADRAQAKIEVEKRRQVLNGLLKKAVSSIDNVWYINPSEFKESDLVRLYYNRSSGPLAHSNEIWIHGGHNDWKDGVSIMGRLEHSAEVVGDWWFIDVIVPDGAFILDWVFADGPLGSAKVYDNNGRQDFHAIVPKRFPDELYWEEEENQIFMKLVEERRQREEAERLKAEKTARMKIETKERTVKMFLLSQKHIVYTKPLDIQAGSVVTVYYNPSNTVLSGKPEVWFRCSFNRWTHPHGPLPPQKMIPAENSSHLKATIKVPLDAYMLDFVFSEKENGGIFDNKNGMDYHLPVKRGVMEEPPMHIVHVAVEMAPIAKVGGLGDVVTSLSRAVQDLGHKVEIVLPKYDCMNLSNVKDFAYNRTYGWGGTEIKVWLGKVQGLSVYFLEPHNGMFSAGCIYGCRNDGERFGFFCHAALEFLLQSGSCPDILHCHDWSSAPVAWLFKDHYVHYGLGKARVIFTIHNLEFGAALIGKAMTYADKATTVSPNYAMEVAHNPSISPHLHKFHGILNGIDPDIWDPYNDEFIPIPYTSENVIEGKKAAKEALQRRLGLSVSDRPLVGIISRLTHQKGIHLIKHAIWRTLERSGQVVLLGSAPDPRLQNDFVGLANNLHSAYNDRARLCLTYDEPLSHLIYAGSDFILVPSIFEPCGLTQLIAMRYGSIPVVRKTGGLFDTVFDVDHEKERAVAQGLEPNGFSFDGADISGVDYALNRAISAWYDARDWFNSLCKSVMEQDWSWNRPALDYMELYYSARK